MAELSHHLTLVNGLRLHHVEAGRGEPVVFLHGFPEFWYSWRQQIAALADAGYRAIALDLPGYNESDKPLQLARYRVRSLVDDIAAFVRQVAGGPACVVGHDWGGILAWRLAAMYPEQVRKLAILNAPHPLAYRALVRRNPLQWLRSWYILLFQVRGLPEAILSAGDFALLKHSWRTQPVHPGAFSKTDLAAHTRALSQPGGLTCPLNYYRAAPRYTRDIYGPPQTIPMPTLVIWGERDPYLGVQLLAGLDRWAPKLRIERIPDASHWVQNDVPEKVNRLLVNWLASVEA